MPTGPGPATRRRQLGRQLRDLRLAARVRTMEAAAEMSGLSRATISRIENAKQTILPRTVPDPTTMRWRKSSYSSGA